MPGGKEKGSHHGREKEVFRDVQETGGRGVAQSELDPGSTEPPLRCFLRVYPTLKEALRGRGTNWGSGLHEARADNLLFAVANSTRLASRRSSWVYILSTNFSIRTSRHLLCVLIGSGTRL